MNIYETDRLLAEYLLFHFAEDSQILPWAFGPHGALRYAERCVSECFNLSALGEDARALDLGCAVGRSTFELARHCREAIGIDFSHRFIEAAQRIAGDGAVSYHRLDEGELRTALTARAPEGIDRTRLRFEVGDAMDLRPDLGKFDAVLLANLIDRLREPRRCLARLPDLLNAGGQLVIASPYTWIEEFTPRSNWLGGVEGAPTGSTTLARLEEILSPAFELVGRRDLPFLIREHQRKFQWSVAEASIWRRRA